MIVNSTRDTPAEILDAAPPAVQITDKPILNIALVAPPYFDVPPFLIPKVTDPPFDCETIKRDIQADGSVQVKAPDDNCVMQTIDDGNVKLSGDDTPATRFASMHVNGLDYVVGLGDDGSNVGNNISSLVAPGGSERRR